jgi:hypothetical protein
MARGRAREASNAASASDNGATVGYEAQLRQMVGALRGSNFVPRGRPR